MYSRSAAFYDALYSWKNYAEEAERLHALLQAQRRAGGSRLLDVGCGTGSHLPFLSKHYRIEGLDLDPGMVEIARQKNPDVPIHCGDMADFHIGGREGSFDFVISLFSSIGYVRTRPRLQAALGCMARHLAPEGVIVVEPWFTPETHYPGRLHALTVDRPDLKISRMSTSAVEPGETNDLSVLFFHYLVGTPSGIDYFTERHELGLFTDADMRSAFEQAGLEVRHDENGLCGRGLYIGRRQDA